MVGVYFYYTWCSTCIVSSKLQNKIKKSLNQSYWIQTAELTFTLGRQGWVKYRPYRRYKAPTLAWKPYGGRNILNATFMHSSINWAAEMIRIKNINKNYNINRISNCLINAKSHRIMWNHTALNLKVLIYYHSVSSVSSAIICAPMTMSMTNWSVTCFILLSRPSTPYFFLSAPLSNSN